MKRDIERSPDSRLPRRTILQWFAASAAAATSGGVPLPSMAQSKAAPAVPGYGTDPNLVQVYEPGDVWPLTFSEEDRKLVEALADIILPEDDLGPAASQVRVPDYIDEWVSAPYPNQQRDRSVIVPGLARFEDGVRQAHGKSFSELDESAQVRFCRSIVEDESHPLAGFFHRFTMVASGAYFSTTEGWKAIGYVGNMASGVFAGPPQEVLDRVGVEQTVS